MKTILIIASLIILSSQFSILNSTLWEIKQDGTGDLTSITAGIDAAQNGDTLLVYPGRYVENIELVSKDIILTSLYGVTSEDRSIISNTIIDGNQSGSVVLLRDNTRQTILNGFTITNGSGDYSSGSQSTGDSYGGGIDISRSSAIISNCFIEYNNAYFAGGIYQSWLPNIESHPLLQGNIIRYNRAVWSNGGVSGRGIQFCNNIPNSIYHNYSGVGTNDLITGELRQQVLVLDTFTVSAEVAQASDNYFYRNIGWEYEPQPDNFVFIVLNSKIEPVASDLYVSPEGCDSNSGLSFDEPLRTIAFAMAKINPDCVNRRNIFLDEGIYSHSLNNQVFSVKMRSNVNIIGQGKEKTILDMEHIGWAFTARETSVSPSPADQNYVSNFSIRNLSITNGGQSPQNKYQYFQMHTGIMIESGKDYEIVNIGIYNGMSGRAFISSALYSWNNHYSFVLKDIDIYNNCGSIGLDIRTGGRELEDPIVLTADNIRIRKNHPYSVSSPPFFSAGTPVKIIHQDYSETPFQAEFSNLEITDNNPQGSGWGGSFIFDVSSEYYPGKLRLINTTIGNNTSSDMSSRGGIHLAGNVEVDIVNSIIYGQTPNNLILIGNIRNHQMIINIEHSLFEGRESGIRLISNPNADVRWGEGVISTEPGWIGEEINPDYPYMLSEDSPARGGGTLNIPGFEFPEYDLAGNPRIVDGVIDMGAYQWQPATSVDDDVETGYHTVRPDYNLRNFPNPAVTLLNHRTVGVDGYRSSTTGTNIAFELPEAGEVMIEIYNLKGQFVKRIFDAYIPIGEHNVFWDGRDERGRYVATGFYMYNLHINDQFVATGRATFIK